MARNAEKAMTTLARWRAAQIGGEKSEERRPFLASSCYDLKQAEKWRRQIISEISRKVAQIQNAGLGEHRIRDLNDEINKLLREKGHWEDRIKELGGTDYAKMGPKMLDAEGTEVPGNRGYKYFGAAKDLPGVRELFESEAPPPPRKTRGELMKHIDPDYYGYLDEDDGILIPFEAEAEAVARDELLEKWKVARANEKAPNAAEGGADEPIAAGGGDGEGNETQNGTALKRPVSETRRSYVAHVAVPSQKEVEAALLQRKKQQLLDKYVSEDLAREEFHVKTMLGIEKVPESKTGKEKAA
ncbi:pre-mRNA-splicing factor isy1-like [Tropilaelaps mercedesae]|uniref:Pre-mRNA-splicing factor isy1-like n=1 Tax=Tropilaelaps mercedesae TaxID=418985 RepID=A0A1V9X6B6_9ACAR|nr:pre-mRNA-splicing factor isy1-like [Tropilaelaps mercedesae]